MRAKCVETEAPQRSPTWYHLRLGKITASQFADAAGFGFNSPTAFYKIATGEKEGFQGNVATAWGQEFEEEACRALEAELDDFITPAGFCISERDPWLGASPDGWAGDSKDVYIELKCPYSKPLYDEVPDYYIPQIVGGMAVTGRDKCVFACYVPDNARNAETGREPGLRVWGLDWSPTVERYWKALRRRMFSTYQSILLREPPPSGRRPRGFRDEILEELGSAEVYEELRRVK